MTHWVLRFLSWCFPLGPILPFWHLMPRPPIKVIFSFVFPLDGDAFPELWGCSFSFFAVALKGRVDGFRCVVPELLLFRTGSPFAEAGTVRLFSGFLSLSDFPATDVRLCFPR